MGIFEEIGRMEQEGKSEQDMSLLLQESGYSIKEISDAMAQSKIKQAVSEGMPENETMNQYADQNQALERSMMSQPQQTPQAQPAQPVQQLEQEPAQYAEADYQQPQQYSQPAQQDYPQYQQYDTYQSFGSSSDNITEIAEQVMAERLSGIKKQFESVLDMRTTVNARIESLDVRLKRIEKLIDRLQLSILQKVGEYVTNVEDIKKEMVETQKSFKSLIKKQPEFKEIN